MLGDGGGEGVGCVCVYVCVSDWYVNVCVCVTVVCSLLEHLWLSSFHSALVRRIIYTIDTHTITQYFAPAC